MATLVNYHGLQVVSPDPTGDGGLAIQNDFKNLVQWNPKSFWKNSTGAGATNDSTQDFYPGSLWPTPTQLFLCTDSTPLAAIWVPILISSSAANGALLIGNRTGFASSTLTGSVNQVTVTNGPGAITIGLPQWIATSSMPQFAGLGIGIAADPTIGIYVAGTITS